MASPCSSVPGGRSHTHCCSGIPKRKAISSSMPQVSIISLPSTHLCPQLISAWDIDMPGIATLLCFISGAWLVLTTPNLTGLSKLWTQSPPLEGSLSPLHLVPFCAGKTIACPSKGLEFMVKHREICDQVMYPLWGTLSLLLNSCSKVPGGLLFLRDYKPSSKCTPGRGTFSASANQDFPTHGMLSALGLCPNPRSITSHQV